MDTYALIDERPRYVGPKCYTLNTIMVLTMNIIGGIILALYIRLYNIVEENHNLDRLKEVVNYFCDNLVNCTN